MKNNTDSRGGYSSLNMKSSKSSMNVNSSMMKSHQPLQTTRNTNSVRQQTNGYNALKANPPMHHYQQQREQQRQQQQRQQQFPRNVRSSQEENIRMSQSRFHGHSGTQTGMNYSVGNHSAGMKHSANNHSAGGNHNIYHQTQTQTNTGSHGHHTGSHGNHNTGSLNTHGSHVHNNYHQNRSGAWEYGLLKPED